jgi:hypothetical protein
MPPEPVHRSIVAADIVGIARRDRTDQDRLHLLGGLRDLIETVLAGSGISKQQRHLAYASDGAIVVVDPAVPRSRLLHALVTDLAARLDEFNSGQPERRRLQLRVALHAGELLQDRQGYVGEALELTMRLLDATDVLAAFRVTSADLVVVASDLVYRAVIEPGLAGVEPSSYRPVEVDALQTRVVAWVYLHGISGPPPVPPVPPAPPSGRLPPEPEDSYYRSILLVDTENYSGRSDAVKGRLRAHLERMVGNAIAAAGISTAQHDPPHDEGDGLCVLFGPDVPKNRLLHPLVPALARQLAGHNAAAPERERMRLRVVVDAGDLRRDHRGYYGAALDEAYGLVNAEELRGCLRQTLGPVVLAVSPEIYEGIVRHDYDGIDQATYTRLAVRLKQRNLDAWVHYPQPLTGQHSSGG